MIILRQVILYIERVQYRRDRKRRQKQFAKAFPTVIYREKQIVVARQRHRPCRNLIDANKAEVLSALRIEVMQRECARIAADGVRHG